MIPTHRVLWDAPFHDWLATFHPSGTQCFALFNWVLDTSESGPDPADPRAEADTRSCTIEQSGATVFYVAWEHTPIVAVIEILSV